MKKSTKLFVWQTIFCLLFSAKLLAQINLTVSTPVDTAGACRQNLYTIKIKGAPSSTNITVAPTLNFALANCISGTTQGVYMDYVSVSPAAAITNISSGTALTFTTVNTTDTIIITYHAYIDCHVSGNNSVTLSQIFTGSGGVTINGNNNYQHTTTGVLKPELVMYNTTPANQFAYNKTKSFFKFFFRNNVDRGSIRFYFNADSTYCNQVTTDSIFFQKGLNGTIYPYTKSASDTVTLSRNDTLVILQRIETDTCINANSCAGIATLTWKCNYDSIVSSNLCSNCNPPDTCFYDVFNNDLALADVLRFSPSNAVHELSCFNDTANSTLWSYKIINKGRGAMDSLNFDLVQTATVFNSGDLSFLMLIDKNSLSISKSANSICTFGTTLALRADWLCKSLVDSALQHCYVRIKDFGIADTVFFSFRTLRCTEEDNVALLNRPKKYNQWTFSNFYAKDICGNPPNQTGTGLVSGTGVSGQGAGGAGYDFDLKINYFPTVTNLSVDQQGNGDSAVFSMQLKGLVSSGAANVYQLLGCNQSQNQCTTLNGWLRATVYCDTNLRITNPMQHASLIKIDSQGDTAFFYPDYYYTSDTIGTNICRRTSYYFYYNLADSGMRYVIDSGKFVFQLQACCQSDMPITPYSVTFHLLPNPNNCFTLNYTGSQFNSHLIPPDTNNTNGVAIQWLPLSDKQNDIGVLCPGCVSPGIISESYFMRRKSFGLQDYDNDGRADNPPTQITDTSAYFNQYGSNISRNFSCLGDQVEDFLKANFVDGDRNDGGYDYQQLKDQGLRFNVLQLSRFIPMGIDTMKLTPDSIIFYIDDTANLNGGCIDCTPYGMGTNSFTTLLRLSIGGNKIPNYLLASSATFDEFRFAFTTYHDTINNTYSGNLHDNTVITGGTQNFTGFEPSQKYRLRVVYNICGNYMPLNTGSFSANDVVKESRVFNRLFFSGAVQDTVSDLLTQQPNSTQVLDTVFGYTVDPNDSTLNLVDTTFMNSFMFFCEATGAIHYFVSTIASNGTFTNNNTTPGCMKVLTVQSKSTIAGGKSILDIYPNEYRTPLLMPVNYNIQIPTGYYVANASVKNAVIVGGLSAISDTVTLNQFTNASGNISFSSAILPTLRCLTQNNIPIGNDSMFYGDQESVRLLEFRLYPDTCLDSAVVVPVDSTAQIAFNIQHPSCITSANCSLTNLVVNPSGSSLESLLNNPHLSIPSIGNTTAYLNSDTICWNNINILNVDNGSTKAPRADNVFIALINPSPYLSHWHFVSGNNIDTAVSNVIGIRDTLSAGITVTGNLCAVPVSCPHDTSTTYSFNIHFGWNCINYPIPYDSTQVCEYGSTTLYFTKAASAFSITQKSYETPYTLCDTVKVWAPFSSIYSGYLYPDSVLLQNFDNNLVIAGAYIFYGNNHTNAASLSLTPTPNNLIWHINDSAMQYIGYPEGGINNSDEVTIRFDLIPTCKFAGKEILPDFLLYAHNFCNELDSANANYTNSGAFYMDSTSSECENCYALTKTATDTVAYTSQPLTYYIHYCNYSATIDTITINDLLPPNFTTAATLPQTFILNSMQCDSIPVTGTFSASGTCPTTTNTALLIHNSDTLSATACVPVINICSATDTTFANNAHSGTATINNKSILVAGTYTVDVSLTLNNCFVFTAPGAQIIVDTSATFILNNTTIQSCDTMWRGIGVLADASLKVQNNSKIKDANDAITANHTSYVLVDSSSIVDCIRGVFAPPTTSGFINTTIKVARSSFSKQASNFKPDYIGQPSHGNLPRAGIEVNNVIMTLGGDSGKVNEFNKMSAGIIAHNSILTVKRSKFYNISPDVIYPSQTRGNAIVAIANNTNSATLSVMPEVLSYNTVDNCYRGIYTYGVKLFVNYVHVLNVRQGILAQNAPTGSRNTVSNSVVTATNFGISFINNPLAYSISILNDSITINGANIPNSPIQPVRMALQMRETSITNVKYFATYNKIRLSNAHFGIVSSVLNFPKIKHNVISFPDNASGIAISACQYASINCNSVRGGYVSAPLAGSIGVNTGNSSFGTSLYCNSVDSTYRAFNFGGVNPSTVLKGNQMYHHFTGVYLNSANTWIGQQPHNGNRWNSPTVSFGAVNLASQGFLFLSLFSVDSTLGPVYNPTVNPSFGWFSPSNGGNTFYCSTSLVCATIPPTLTQLEYAELIANGVLESEEYAEETQAITAEYLYRELADDSTLWVEDSTYLQFMLENQGEPVEYLYNTEEYLRAAYEYDETFQALIDSASHQIEIINDSIVWLEEHQPQDWEIIREQLINTINFLNQTIENLNIQREASLNDNLDEAQLNNSIVIPDNLPQENTQYINDIEINFLEQGNDIQYIIDNYAAILSIAMQCPYAGGPSVERARTFVALVNDSMAYDDDNVCLQSGIYRNANNTSAAASEIKAINIRPNPANNKVEINLIGKFEGLCNIDLQNVMGKIVKTETMNCKVQHHVMDISKLSPGVYTLRINVNNTDFVKSKLVIVR